MTCNRCNREIPDGAKFCCFCGGKIVSAPRKRMRGNGEGSVYRVGGKWRVEIVLGYDLEQMEDGTFRKHRRTHSRYGFPTKAAAVEYLTNYKQVERTEKTPAAVRHNYDITLKALYDKWFPTHRAGKGTMDCYRAAFKVFEPVWDRPMREQDIDDLQECFDDSGKGKRTLENAKAALGLVYTYGIPRNCIPRDRNLAVFLRIDAQSEQRTMGLNDMELEAIRRRAEVGDHDAQLVLCHCYTGFRPSAFVGLTVMQYDREHHALRGGIKTEAGRDRAVTISPKIQKYVDGFIAASRSSYIFCGVDGRRLNDDSYRELFYNVLVRCGIDNPVDNDGRHRLTPHSCRHTFATLLKRVAGADKDKLELMGHTSGEMLRHYQDVDYSDLRRITDAI